jgi:hypothetical protein
MGAFSRQLIDEFGPISDENHVERGLDIRP